MSADDLLFATPAWLLLLPLPWLMPWLTSMLHRDSPPSDQPPPSGTPVRAIHPLLGLIPAAPLQPVGAPTARSQRRRRWWQGLRRLLAALAASALLLALAEPVRIGQRLPDPPPQRDIVFIVDSSVGMVLRDYQLDGRRVDRMSLLKVLLTRFVERLRGERMAVIVFGERAHTLLPLTRDPDLVTAMVARIRTTLAGRFSAGGEAIALALRETEADHATDTPHNDRHRLLIMLSAAGTPTGDIDARAAAELARERGIPLYTIIIGAPDPGAGEARQTGLIYRPAGAELLRSLAKLSGGLSFTAVDTSAIEDALAAIKAHGSQARRGDISHLRQPLYLWPLLSGLVLLTLAGLVGTRLSNQQRTEHHHSSDPEVVG